MANRMANRGFLEFPANRGFLEFLGSLTGAGRVMCSLDCAALWAPFADRCVNLAGKMPPALAEFFGGRCGETLKVMQVLPPATAIVRLSAPRFIVRLLHI